MGRKRKEIDREQKETTERIKKYKGKTTEEWAIELLNQNPELRDLILHGKPFPPIDE